MKYSVLIWDGLMRNPARTVLTSLSVITAFVLYGVLNGTLGASTRPSTRSRAARFC